jgi:hypothetical protein
MAKSKKPKSGDEKDAKKTFNPKDAQLDIQINSFGEIISNYDIDEINEFLNKNTTDKKINPKKDEEQK